MAKLTFFYILPKRTALKQSRSSVLAVSSACRSWALTRSSSSLGRASESGTSRLPCRSARLACGLHTAVPMCLADRMSTKGHALRDYDACVGDVAVVGLHRSHLHALQHAMMAALERRSDRLGRHKAPRRWLGAAGGGAPGGRRAARVGPWGGNRTGLPLCVTRCGGLHHVCTCECSCTVGERYCARVLSVNGVV